MLGYEKTDLGEKEWQRLKNISAEVVLLPSDSMDKVNNLRSADCLLVKLGATVDKQMIDSAPKLRYIGMLGTGYGRIDAVYAAKKGIAVCNIAGYSTEGVAEFGFGILIEHLREITRAKLQAAKGDYSEATYTGTELKDKKFGVIGLGNIGRRIADIAKNGFQADVSYWSKHRKKDAEDSGIMYKEIANLLQESDFVTLNLSYVPQTEKFLNEERINLINPGAVVLNLAPMELVDIDALESRLKKDDITFILDHSDELTQKQAKQLSKYKNCIIYPPIGYVTKEASAAKRLIFVDNIKNFLHEVPTNRVN